MKINRLKDVNIRRQLTPKSYPDGNGLYLQVRTSGSKDWFFRYEVNGKDKKKGLGPYPTISLENARALAHECRLLRVEGQDPVDFAKQQKLTKQIKAAQIKTFEECATEYINTRKVEWSNKKHTYQWTQSLTAYAFPYFGEISVQEITVAIIMEALTPIWETKTETATRVRRRVEAVLDYATALHYREGENPARWKGHLDKILPKPSKVTAVVHHPAMPYLEVSEFYRNLRKKQTIASSALAFIVLTATRSGEGRGARWDEIDMESSTWTIPAERMKARKLFRIPLTSEAMSILKNMEKIRKNDWVFAGLTKGNVTEAAVRKLLKSTHPNLTTHGFRSTFRDYCAELTNFPREIAEAALAHALESKTEAAYQRGDLLEKRTKLMQTWENFLLAPKADVIPIRQAIEKRKL
ncbi:MAG: integrase arm-type DNA-binding domain-containing protein [SAR324 cluster bacterium]|nr:integrase arm-type DNA-binding domain-containing protein [SAR324 cluster bacterium]